MATFEIGAQRYVRHISENPEMSNGKLLSRIKPGSTVLEFGCASGAMTSVMKTELGCDVTIVEIDQSCYETAQQYAVDGWCGDIETMEWREYLKGKTFDYIIFADVLEHLHNSETVLSECGAYLKREGSVLISVPNLAHNSIIIQLLQNRFTYQNVGLLDYTHVHFFTFCELQDMVMRSGYTPVYLDATYIAVGKNELDVSYWDIDPIVAEALRKRPLGEVYQHIVELKKSEYITENPSPVLDCLGIAKAYRETLSEKTDIALRNACMVIANEIATEPNQYFCDNNEIARLRLEINDLYAAEASLADTETLIRQNFEKQEEIREKNTHIRKLITEGEAKDTSIRMLQAQMAEEIEKRDTSVRTLQAQMAEEIEKRDTSVRTLQAQMAEEIEKRDNSVRQIQDRSDQEIAARDSVIRQLREELNNKKGHIELLLQSDRELAWIKGSRCWKAVQKYYHVMDVLVPQGSRRRLIAKLFAKFVRHPVWFLQRVDFIRIKKFIKGTIGNNIEATSQHLDNWLERGTDQVEKIDVLDVSKENNNIESYARFTVPTSDKPLVSIVIPVYNQFHYTYACLKSIALNSGDVPYEILIANDCSTDLTQRLEEIIGGVKLITNEKNMRFLLNCNHAAKQAKGRYILFLNNDTQVQENWLQPLVELIEKDPKAGMVGSKLVYPDGRLQEAGGILWKDGSAWNYGHFKDPSMPEFNYVKEADYISGAAIMIRSDLWKQLGGFDETLAPAYYEDTDLAFQVRAAGYKVLFQPRSVVVHFEGVSNGTNTNGGQKAYQVVNAKKFYEKWKNVLEKEHNPNGVDPFRAKDRSLHKKTILIVDHYVPMFDKDAGSRYMFHYVKMFLRMGYNVKFMGDNFYPHQPYTEVLQQMGVEVIYGNWYAQHWKDWLKEMGGDLDYIILSRPHISIKYIDYVRQVTKAKIIYIGHDLHFWREQKRYETTGDEAALQESKKWKEIEYYLFKHVDMSYFLSNLEIARIHEDEPDVPLRRTPINIFEEIPDVSYDAAKRKDILFVGGFGHAPNVDAVKWAINEIMPLVWQKLPDVKIHVVGSNAPEEVLQLANERVIMDGFVSDERLSELYRECRLELVPLRYGGGVKGKVVEAMYNGMPLVTTSTGTEGIDGSENIVMMGATKEELSGQIINAYSDFEKLKTISENEVRYVREFFSIDYALKILSNDFDFSAAGFERK